MNKHYPFPKIRQFHQVIRDLKLRAQYVGKDENGDAVYDGTLPLPVVSFVGYEKQHGTNSAVVVDKDCNWYCQSRERIITPEDDNAGFARWFKENGYKGFFNIREVGDIVTNLCNEQKLIVFGEWAGGSIQKGVALNQLPKMFIIFGAKIVSGEDEELEHIWIDSSQMSFEEHGIYNVSRGPKFEFDVDLARPELILEKLNQWVEEIDKESPFAKTFGVSGAGEGFVARPKDSFGFNMALKCKGESHSKSKIKKLPTVDVEKSNSIHEAVNKYCNEDRMEQAYAAVVLKEEDKTMQKVPDFMRWILNDIMTEEGDALEASGITQKDMGKAISRKAPTWFKNKISSF